MQALCGPWSWEPLAELQGRRREAGSKGSCKQSAGLTNRKRARGVHTRAKGHEDPKREITRRVWLYMRQAHGTKVARLTLGGLPLATRYVTVLEGVGMGRQDAGSCSAGRSSSRRRPNRPPTRRGRHAQRLRSAAWAMAEISDGRTSRRSPRRRPVIGSVFHRASMLAGLPAIWRCRLGKSRHKPASLGNFVVLIPLRPLFVPACTARSTAPAP